MHPNYSQLRPRHYISWVWLVGAGLLLLPISVGAAVVPIDSLPQQKLVADSPERLETLGCARLIFDQAKDTTAIPGGMPYYVIPRDDLSQHFACSSVAAAQIEVIPGEVAAAIALAQGQAVLEPARAVKEQGLPLVQKTAQQSGSKQGFFMRTIGAPVLKYANLQIVGVLSLILLFINKLGLWVVDMTSVLFSFVMTYDRFRRSGFVQAGWPFVQGLANIGFILALLLIALATVLRLDIGGGVRRLLPRLLIAALLVNFSLLIGSLLIDMSRIVMAAFIFMVGDINPRALGAGIIKETDLLKNAFNAAHNMPFQMSYGELPEGLAEGIGGPWVLLLNQVIATAFTWMLAFAFVALSFAFSIRYVILLILLTLSPLAYAGVALPAAKGMVAKYWSTFMRWVLFGPAAVFLLVLITKVGEFAFVPKSLKWANVYESFAHIIIVAIMIYTAIFAGNYVGGVGGNLSLSFAKGINNRVRRGLVGGAKLGGKGLYVGTGARAIGRFGRDIGRTAKSNIVGAARSNRFTKKFMPVKRDKEGKPMPGQVSLGMGAARTVFPAPSKEAARVKGAPHSRSDIESNIAYNPENLASSSARSYLSKKQLGAITKQDLGQALTATTAAEEKAELQGATAADHVAAATARSNSVRISGQLKMIFSDPVAVARMDEAEIAQQIKGPLSNELMRSIRVNSNREDKA